MSDNSLSQDELNAMLNMVGGDDEGGADLSSFASTFIEHFRQAFATSINGEFELHLAGTEQVAADDLEAPASVVMTSIPVEEAAEGSMFLLAPLDLASIAVDLMMMGEGEAKDSLEDEDIEAFNDLINNSASAAAVPLSEESGSKIRFGSMSSSQLDAEGARSAIGDSVNVLRLDAAIPDKVSATLILAIPDELASALGSLFGGGSESGDSMDDDLFDFGSDDFSDLGDDAQTAAAPSTQSSDTSFDKDQLRNIDMLMDIDLAVIIRIGSTEIYLKDLLKLGSGSIVELDKKASDPVELVVNNKVIARGEVVVIDSNFGLRINEILSKKDRLNSLRG